MEEDLQLFISMLTGDTARMQQLHDLANNLMTIPDIAILLQVDCDMLTLAIRDGDNVVAKAYLQGKAERVLAIHQKDVKDNNTENLHAFLQQMNAAES